MSVSTKNVQKNVKKSLANTWDQNQRSNSLYNVGSEVEDLISDEEGLPIGNRDAEAIMENLVRNENADPTRKEIGGEERLLGTNIEDERFQRHVDFPAEIDTDYHPAQSEIATEVFRNPADMAFRTENLRYLRDRNLPEGMNAHELAMFSGLSLPGLQPEDKSMPKARYTGLSSRHGDAFDAMGWIGATQLNTGSPVGEEMSTEEFFHSFFNGGEKPSMLDVVPAVDALFANDPVFQEGEDELYEMVAEGGRDIIYDFFVSKSPAVLRRNTERWGDILDEAIPTNENYGNIEDLSGIEDHEDYIDMAMERPMILSPEVDASNMQVLDPETREPIGTVEEEYGKDSTWVMPGLSEVEESTVSFDQFLEDRQYLGEILVEGEDDLVPVKVDHTNLEEDEFQDLAGLGREDEAGYFTFHNTFVRPDVAPKNNGVVEFRSFSNSPRSYEALLTQKSLMHVYEGVQDLFADHGLSSENSLDVREDVKREGLDAQLPSGHTVQEVYENNLVDLLAEGVRESFSGEEVPYSMGVVLEGIDHYDDFGDYLDKEFEDLRDFTEYTSVAFEAGLQPEPGEYSMNEFEEEYNEFVDWFTETYRDTMQQYLNEPTEAEKLEKQVNEKGGQEALTENVRDNHAEAF